MKRLCAVFSTASAVFALDGRTITVSADGGGDFSSISAAAEVAAPGDVVAVGPGIYREEVRVANSGGKNAPIVFRSSVRGKAVIRGSEVWRTGWKRLGDVSGNLWTGEIDRSLFPVWTNSPYLRTVSIAVKDKSRLSRPVTNDVVTSDTYMPRTLGQVFMDGDELTEVADIRALESVPDTWMVSTNGSSIWLHPAETRPEPARCLVEWSVRNRCFGAARRGLHDVVVDGFTVEHCANQGPFPQIGAIDTRSGIRWTIENCTVRHVKAIGIACGSETWNGEEIGDMPAEDRRLMSAAGGTVRYNTVSWCGVSGIAAWHPGGLAIYCNTVMHCGGGAHGKPERYWGETAGIKVHLSPVVIANNIVIDNDGHCGIWFDTGFTNTRCTGNYIANNNGSGIEFETCDGFAMCDHNIIVGTRTNSDGFYGGNGIYSHNGHGITIAHNLFAYNAGAGVRFRTLWGKHRNGVEFNTSSNRFVNNIFCANAKGELMLPFTNRLSHGTVSSGNLYLPAGGLSGKSKGLLFPFRIAYYNQGGVSWETIYERCREAGETGFGYDEWMAMGHPLSLDAWRKTLGLDIDSMVLRTPTETSFFAPHEMSARFFFPKETDSYRVPSIDGPVADYAGEPYPVQGTPVRPGPFQTFDWRAEGIYRALRPPVLRDSPPWCRK